MSEHGEPSGWRPEDPSTWPVSPEELLQEAREAAKNAYVPYSHFPVGATLLDREGRVWRGCNIENAALSVTNCAERTALFKAVSEGVHDFVAIAVVGGETGEACAPCGVCRQALAEWNPKLPVILEEAGKPRFESLDRLLYGAFLPARLNRG